MEVGRIGQGNVVVGTEQIHQSDDYLTVLRDAIQRLKDELIPDLDA